MDDTKVLVKLMTDATANNQDDIASCIGKVKAGDSHKNSIKNLHTAKKEILIKTYAFLINKKEDDDKVIKLTKEGLEVMIMYRLKQLMPDVCAKCNKEHLTTREETPMVTCRMCGTGACNECFTIEEGMNKWFHLCKVCDEFIQQQRGEEALEKSHLNQKLKKKTDSGKKTDENKKTEKAADKKENEDVVKIKDDSDDSTDEEDEEEGEEGEEDEEGFKQVTKKKRGFKKEVKTTEAVGKASGKKEKKDIVCSHFRKACCFFGMSGKVPYNGSSTCPYKHPKVCQRLLRHGDKGRAGCRGKSAGCQEFHPRMCFSLMNTRMCSNMKECSNGYHMKGTTEYPKKVQERVIKGKEQEKGRFKEKYQETFPALTPGNKSQGSLKADNPAPSSPFCEILLQQKELLTQMKEQKEQSRRQQEQSNMLQALLASLMDQRSASPLTAGPVTAPSLSMADCLRMRMVGSG